MASTELASSSSTSRLERFETVRALIVCVSISHGNTRRIADAMAEEIDAVVQEPEEIDAARIGAWDLVGFGSGIYNFQFHERLRGFIEQLPQVAGTPTFYFATSGFGAIVERPWQQPVARLLKKKGFRVIDSFCCRGFDTSPAVRVAGGINKGRPNARDLEAARSFAARVRKRAIGLRPKRSSRRP